MIKDIPINKIIVGKIDKLYIRYKYNKLNLLKLNCNVIYYSNQKGDSIKNHKLPNSLTKLYCDRNKLTYLPNLPNSLKILYCGNNQLTYLPKLPNSLKILYCNNNKIKSLNLDLNNNLIIHFYQNKPIEKLKYNPKLKLCSVIENKIVIDNYNDKYCPIRNEYDLSEYMELIQ